MIVAERSTSKKQGWLRTHPIGGGGGGGACSRSLYDGLLLLAERKGRMEGRMDGESEPNTELLCCWAKEWEMQRVRDEGGRIQG
jgi:hypothetical protein